MRLYSILMLITLPTWAIAQTTGMPITLINNSGNDSVYFITKAFIPGENGGDCFIRFENDTATCDLVQHIEEDEFKHYTYSLKDNESINLQLPQVASGRIYISLGQPMMFPIVTNDLGDVKIVDPNEQNPRDPNYYTLFDKVEFTNDGSHLVINPTAVDFFALPLRIYNEHEASGIISVGLYEHDRNEIFTTLRDVITSHTTEPIWQKLFLNFENTPLRVVSPNKSMEAASGFDPHYLDNEATYGFNYIDFVWDYYKNNTLKIDISELGISNYIFTGQVNNQDDFVFTHQFENGNTKTITIEKPADSKPFFQAGGGTFAPEEGMPEKNIIVRDLSAAFIVGLLPQDSDEPLSKAYFLTQKNQGLYYQNNPILKQENTGPWYDLYGRALHSFDEHMYAFAYDDQLGQDGTMFINNKVTTPTEVTLGRLGQTTLPTPKIDNNKYTLTVTCDANAKVEYEGLICDGTQKTLNNVPMPFKVKIKNDIIDIYVKHPMVIMPTPYSNSAFGIEINGTEIKFPSEWQ